MAIQEFELNLSCRINKNFSAVYNYDNSPSKGKIYQVKNIKHAEFINYLSTSEGIKHLFPSVRRTIGPFVDAEWVEGDLASANHWIDVVDLLIRIQCLKCNKKSSFDYVNDLIMPRFNKALPLVGLNKNKEIIEIIKKSSNNYSYKVSHPDLIPGNIVKRNNDYIIIDNELLCYTRHHRIDILNMLKNITDDLRIPVLLKYLTSFHIDVNQFKMEYSYLSSLWLAREMGSFLVKDNLPKALEIFEKYKHGYNILPFDMEGLSSKGTQQQ